MLVLNVSHAGSECLRCHRLVLSVLGVTDRSSVRSMHGHSREQHTHTHTHTHSWALKGVREEIIDVPNTQVLTRVVRSMNGCECPRKLNVSLLQMFRDGRTIHIQCVYGIFGREITEYTAVYGVYVRFWPTLQMFKLCTERRILPGA